MAESIDQTMWRASGMAGEGFDRPNRNSKPQVVVVIAALPAILCRPWTSWSGAWGMAIILGG